MANVTYDLYDPGTQKHYELVLYDNGDGTYNLAVTTTVAVTVTDNPVGTANAVLPSPTEAANTTLSLDRRGRVRINQQTDTASHTTVAQTTVASTAFLAVNTSRSGLIVFNDTGVGNLFLNFGATCTSSAFATKIPFGTQWVMPSPAYTGVITCTWDNNTGSGNALAQITELS